MMRPTKCTPTQTQTCRRVALDFVPVSPHRYAPPAGSRQPPPLRVCELVMDATSSSSSSSSSSSQLPQLAVAEEEAAAARVAVDEESNAAAPSSPSPSSPSSASSSMGLLLQVLPTERTPCGYCSSTTTTAWAHNAWMHSVTPDIYEALCERGWRRHGALLYRVRSVEPLPISSAVCDMSLGRTEHEPTDVLSAVHHPLADCARPVQAVQGAAVCRQQDAPLFSGGRAGWSVGRRSSGADGS
jgi:hypothetical protein